MIQTRNKYLQFMLVLLAAWAFTGFGEYWNPKDS